VTYSPFLGLGAAEAPELAQVLLLPLPFEGTACYGKGTAKAPPAIWQASTHIEDWDEETGFNLTKLAIHSGKPVFPSETEVDADYLQRVREEAVRLRNYGGLVIGIGGEHSLTPPLVKAAVDCGLDPTELTVLQFDAHADLRDSYEGSRFSHACGMRRLVEMGVRILAVGIRSAEEAEMKFGLESQQVETFYAHELAQDEIRSNELERRLKALEGPLYITVDIDCLEVHLCPATGTPQPGGLGWWQALGYLRSVLLENSRVRLVGADLVETVPSQQSRVNEFVAARLICKILSYWFG
jgi:agmatinase